MGTNWDEKYNPENLNFLKIPSNIALPTVFSDALSYYEQISKMYHCLLDIVEKVNGSVDKANEALGVANQALAGVDVAKLKADSKVCVYFGATPLTLNGNVDLGEKENFAPVDYFIVSSENVDVLPTVCIDYRNSYVGVVSVNEENNHVIITSRGVGLDIPNVVKVIEQTFTDAEKTQARNNIGAAEKNAVFNLQTAVNYLQDNSVLYAEQNDKSEPEKAQARANIGASSASDTSTLTVNVQMLLSKAVLVDECQFDNSQKEQARENIDAASVQYVDGKPHVPAVVSGDTGKVLTAGGAGSYSWETPLAISGTADVLMVNITGSGSSYSADKTFAQIGQALVAHWPVIFVVNGELQIANVHEETVNSATVYSGVFVGEDYSTVKVTIDSSNGVTVVEQGAHANPYYEVTIPLTATVQAESGSYTGQTWNDILNAVNSGKLVCVNAGGSLHLLNRYSKATSSGPFTRIHGELNNLFYVALTETGWETTAQ